MSAPAQDALVADVKARLAKVLGPEKAAVFVQETLATLGLPALATPQDLMVFATHLVGAGGFVGIVGRSLRVQAMLRGAVETPATRTG